MAGIRKGGGGKTQGKGKRRQPALRVVATDGQRVGTEGIGAAPCGPDGQLAKPQRKPKVRGPVLPTLGVTAKEEAFCQAVADGHSMAEAFRMSHDAQDMIPETVWRQAIRVSARDRVRARIDTLVKAKEQETLHDRRRAISWALRHVQRLVEDSATPAAAAMTGLQVALRYHGALTDRQEIDINDGRSAEELANEIRDRLAALLGPQPKVA